jgi:hypothetical protein
MRLAPFLAVALALGALPAAASPTRPRATVAVTGEATTTIDLRCLMVSAMLAQGDDPDLKDIGTLSLYYFWGRLEGHVPVADVAQRLIDQAKTMTPEELKAQAQNCAALSTKASQNLSDISDALQKSLGPPPATPTPPETAPAAPETTPTAPTSH